MGKSHPTQKCALYKALRSIVDPDKFKALAYIASLARSVTNNAISNIL